MAPAAVRIGTAGWRYQDWDGPFYPVTPPPDFDALAFYAGHFDTVEVNSTFYRIPAARTVVSWLDRTPAEFVFVIKIFSGLTHADAKSRDQAYRQFLGVLRPLTDAGRLGCLLAQFPPSFRPNAAADARLAELAARTEGRPTVVEFRHASWLSAGRRTATVERLRSLGLGVVNVDEPSVGGNLPATELSTGPVGYVRLHGRNAADWWPRITRRRAADFRRGIERTAGSPAERRQREARLNAALEAQKAQRYNYLYSAAELQLWLPRIAQVRAQTDVTFVVTNNHYVGQAVANAKMLQRALGESVHGAAVPGIEGLIQDAERSAEGGPRPDAAWAQVVADLAR